jgi:hypothetical protein
VLIRKLIFIYCLQRLGCNFLPGFSCLFIIDTVNKEVDFYILPSEIKSRDSSVHIALGYGLDDWGSRVRFPVGAGNFSLHHCVQNGSGAHPASYAMGTRGSFPGVKWPAREADHSPPSRAKIKE